MHTFPLKLFSAGYFQEVRRLREADTQGQGGWWAYVQYDFLPVVRVTDLIKKNSLAVMNIVRVAITDIHRFCNWAELCEAFISLRHSNPWPFYMEISGNWPNSLRKIIYDACIFACVAISEHFDPWSHFTASNLVLWHNTHKGTDTGVSGIFKWLRIV